MARSRLVPLLLAPLAVLPAACGGGDDTGGLPTVNSTPTESSSSTPATAPTPTPTAVPTQTVTKYRDLTLELRRPATVDRKAEPGVKQFLALHDAMGALMGGAARPAELSTTASPAVIKVIDDLLKPQLQKKERGAGTLVVRVTKAQAAAKAAVVQGCFNQRQVTTIRSNGSRYVDPTVQTYPTLAIRTTITLTAGGWQVTEYSLKGASC